ncbi:BrnA antitoxin family protein [Ensifer sp.]|uniref:BrnA antitoxin family protein n=1 Tax=Ensifer sp. TaxID=1872086 RepID=UPI0028A24370|nr:BrnA antitoxin family protein [Ensifer sp.]
MVKAIFHRATADLVQQVLERPRAVKKKAPLSGAAMTKLTLNIDTEVIAWFKASGADWRTKMQEALRNATDLDKSR